jgi:hypothetical protein
LTNRLTIRDALLTRRKVELSLKSSNLGTICKESQKPSPHINRRTSTSSAYSSSTPIGLVYALSEQGVGDVEETGYVGPIKVVARGAVLFGCLVAGGVNVLHDLL